MEADTGKGAVRVCRLRYSIRRLEESAAKLGFSERIRGDHHISVREGIEELLNLQPYGNQAKPYQVKQVRHVIVKCGLVLPDALTDDSAKES